MCLVGEAEHHHVVQFAAHLAVGSQGGGSVDFGTHVDKHMFAGGEGGPYATALHHLAVGTQVDGAVGHVEDGALGLGSGLDEYLGGSVGKAGVADDAVRRAERLAGAAAGDEFEIGLETLAVEQEDVVEVVNVAELLLASERGGVTPFAEVGFAAPEGDDRILVDQRLARLQPVYLGNQCIVGDEVTGDEEVVGGDDGRIFPGHIFGGDIGVAAGQQAFPLFSQGEDTHAYVGDGAGEGQGQQLEMLLGCVEENDIFHNRV